MTRSNAIAILSDAVSSNKTLEFKKKKKNFSTNIDPVRQRRSRILTTLPPLLCHRILLNHRNNPSHFIRIRMQRFYGNWKMERIHVICDLQNSLCMQSEQSAIETAMAVVELKVQR